MAEDGGAKASKWRGVRGAHSHSAVGSAPARRTPSAPFVDDAPELHNLYSDPSLFLCRKVRALLGPRLSSIRWSADLEKELLHALHEEWARTFPHHRLRISTLRKIVEKMAYCSEQLEQSKEALEESGSLNLTFLIREQLRQRLSLGYPSRLSPYHWTQQIALKLSECIALIEAERPDLNSLSRMVWALHKHLLPPSCSADRHNPYEARHPLDTLLARWILDTTSRDPYSAGHELGEHLQGALEALRSPLTSTEPLHCSTAALLAHLLYPHSSLHLRLTAEQKRAMCGFIETQLSLCLEASPLLTRAEMVRRVIALYALACRLPKDLSREALAEAVGAVYPTPTQTAEEQSKTALPQSVYAFLSAQCLLMKTEELCHSTPHVLSMVQQAYGQARLLPSIAYEEQELLETAVWKVLSQKEQLLEKLPYHWGKRLEEEIAYLLIEQPTISFSGCVHQVVHTLQKSARLTQKEREIDQKVALMAMQGDLLCRSLRWEGDSTLLKRALALFTLRTFRGHAAFVNELVQAHLAAHPRLGVYLPALTARAWIAYKYAWYCHLGGPEETGWERFLQWHLLDLLCQQKRRDLLEREERELLIAQLEQLAASLLPALPFDRAQARSLLETLLQAWAEGQEVEPQSDEEKA